MKVSPNWSIADFTIGAIDASGTFTPKGNIGGDVTVLATPRLIALCEEASCQALEDELPENCTSVAKRVQFDHLVPVGVGGAVCVWATQAEDARRNSAAIAQRGRTKCWGVDKRPAGAKAHLFF